MARFPKSVRLRRRVEFLEVQQRGKKLGADSLTAMVLRNGRSDGATRLGLTVSSKVGNAVVRNRVRRRLREVCRDRRGAWPRGLDVVLIARPSAKDADLSALKRAVVRLEADLARSFS